MTVTRMERPASPDSATNEKVAGSRPSGPPPEENATPQSRSPRFMDVVDEITSALGRSFYLERRALGLVITDFGHQVLLSIVLWAIVGSLLVASALLIVAGLRSGLALLTADAWWSDLVIGAGMMISTTAGIILARGVRRRLVIAQTLRAVSADAKKPTKGEKA